MCLDCFARKYGRYNTTLNSCSKDMTLEEAEALYKKFIEAYPELTQWRTQLLKEHSNEEK